MFRSLKALMTMIILAMLPATARGQPAGEPQIKAAFVYNFLKFVEWPDAVFSGPSDSLVVGVVGDGPTTPVVMAFLAGKQAAGRSIAVRRLAHPATGADVSRNIHAIFIGGSDARRARQVLEAWEGRGVVTIGEADGFAADGGVIALVVEGKRVRFDVNPGVAGLDSVRISSKLLALARTVFPGKPEHSP
jgi:hypothetical protein